MKRSLSLAALTAASVLVLSACGGGGDDSDGADGFKPVAGGKLTVCSDIPYEPFEFTDENNETVGFDIDLAQKLADRLELELDVVTTPFEAIESGSALDTAQCDTAISGMSITDERATKFDFSEKYLLDNLGLMVVKDSGIKSLDELEGKEVGAQQATTGESYAQDAGAKVVQFEDSGLLTQAITSGQIDAAVANLSTIYAATEASDKIELAENYDTDEVLGAGFKKGNTELTDEFNTMLHEMYEDGSYDELVEEWFGDIADAAKVPEDERGA
ncbi:ABC transporter substrate-binding protein [Brevibacterium otitidis]|uniref:ABC transporter substrate-binding protein n=1 Tax=Brevibacterium otitidis TaxID=53364 RepID=A0ABV5X1F2_9MICO|nr:basic amino acid ABC transporter substrate-binding protein [Brevibacterium otitidis]